MKMNKTTIGQFSLRAGALALMFGFAPYASLDAAEAPRVEWDALSLKMDGKRVVPAMGEVHYSRIPANEWRAEVKKMKAGGLTMLATYVFWNHHEEVEGEWNWTGQRDLRKFLEICRDEGMPVILRLGPFCHGEVRAGGIPDYVFKKGCRVRDDNPRFMAMVETLYRQIFEQVKGLQWKDGGPIVAAQFDNEYGGHGKYLMALKAKALEIGYDLPFYTRTGWPKLRSPIPFGEMVPLYGDYADGFWDRHLKETTGNYYKAFNFKGFRSSTAIATEQLGEQKAEIAKSDADYPYFTCELGGGMMQAYHRRPMTYPQDAYSLAVVKLGSGSNLLGYYMYHGGTNPEGKESYLNEHQGTPGVNYNDMPCKNYDFDAPLGEFGQPNAHYYRLRKLHLFLQDFGEMLAPMEASFPMNQDRRKGDDSSLRWSYRTDGERAFVFVNNYERLQKLTDKKDITFTVGKTTFPAAPITVPANTACIFPVNVAGLDYATAQLIAQRDGKVILEQIPGIPTELSIDGKVMTNVAAKGLAEPVAKNIYLIDSATAERYGLPQAEPAAAPEQVAFTKVKEAAPEPRTIAMGSQKVAAQPSDADFEKAAVYTIKLPAERANRLLKIAYRGDVARLYANGKLVADQFYYGKPMLLGLWRLPEGVNELELKILPLQKDMPVYFPREADVREGEEVTLVTVVSAM